MLSAPKSRAARLFSSSRSPSLESAAVLGLFVISYAFISLRVGRFCDEDIAIGHGLAVLRALFLRTDAARAIAADLDGANSIGLPVGIPAGIAFWLSRDILWVRLVMGFWALLYWGGLLSLFHAIWLKGKSGWSTTNEALMAFIALCFIQAVPWSYMNQAMALGELPGAALLFFGFAAYVRGQPGKGALLTGAALVLKLYYVIYLPASAVVFLAVAAKRPWLSRANARKLGAWSLYYAGPVVALQLFKLGTFGPSQFLGSWSSFLATVAGQSGVSAHSSAVENEWIHYSGRTQAYWLLGVLGPVFLFLVLSATGWVRRNPRLAVMLGAIAVCGAVGGGQWYFLAPLKWWRRSYPFVVPGYAITVIGALFVLTEGLGGRKKLMRGAIVAVLLLALYVQVRQTIIGSIVNTRFITAAERHSYSDPYIESSKVGL